jgi:hypothetical protein
MLAHYTTGNVKVTLASDGTSTREWPDNERPRPESPCSVDLKITQQCDGATICRWCHESSHPRGTHADAERLIKIVDGLPNGVEIAIGGGNTFAHPRLLDILAALSDGLICNVTVNAQHVAANLQLINYCRKEHFIHGLGISYIPKFFKDMVLATDSNTVIHFIAGVHNVWDAIESPFPKVLVLGYKHFGFGVKYHTTAVDDNLKQWRNWVHRLSKNRIISFDNLAVEQLGIRERVTGLEWENHYLGDDGVFSMYVDAVKNEYAVSSTSERVPMGDLTIKEAFQEMRRNAE